MHLSRLAVFGFKTFADQTKIAFHPGITGIVGPNGSGKSNLVDAIRWVLGEQSSRSLRSQKLEDVIFAGNSVRRPLGMAEVSLTFDNASRRLPVDAAEVQITRRAYRAGESEYFINRQSVRLRDVHELMMGTGLGPGSYAIVSQGQIDAILSSKPTERRGLFEETAGIGKFLSRKAEALRRLEGTETNAIRLNDLVSELGRRVPELETQARRARRYHRATARARDLEILGYVRSTASRRSERERAAAELDAIQARGAAAAARAASLGAALAADRNALYGRELALEERRADSQRARAELARLEGEASAAQARLEALEAQLASGENERERTLAERDRLAARRAELEAAIEPLRGGLDDLAMREHEATAATESARRALEVTYAALRTVEAAAAERAATVAQRRAHEEAARTEHARLEREIVAAAGSAERTEALAAASRARYGELEAVASTLENALAGESTSAEAARVAADEATAALGALQTRHRTLAGEIAGAESRLHTIEELEATLEGHVPGTRAVIEAAARGELHGLHGVVSNLIAVEERYARALDVAFGAGLSNIVTERSEGAEEAVAYLRRREAGRATFLPLDTLGSRTGRDAGAPARPGVIGYAHTLVSCEERYRGIVAFLVGRVLIVDVLATGIALVRGSGFRDTIVTLDGEQILGGGAITGGRYRRERSILARRAQARGLREQIPAMREELGEIEADAAAAAARLQRANAERERARATAKEHELRLQDARTQMTALGTEIERLDGEVASAAERQTAAAAAIADVEERLRAFERPESTDADVDEERARLDVVLADIREAIATAETTQRATSRELRERRDALATANAELEAARARSALLEGEGERSAEIRAATERDAASLRERATGYDTVLASAREAVAVVERSLAAERDLRDAAAREAAQREADERIAQREDREATGAGEELRRRLAELDAELGMLAAGFAQNPATLDECADVAARYATESDEVVDELPRLRDELARLANVNLNAEAERAELAEREAFLRAQLQDLAVARDTLLATIREIEGSTQVRFNEVFAAVAERFAEMFARLFPGGQAKMWQTDPENLSESGIELAVQPPGKKMTALPALSGGERAMTAAALIFALIKTQPSPFYLLDEVDAALDDANVDRLSTMIREVAGEAQLVIVTHNKKSMELAAQLYGVTMAEAGVSSVISASLDERPVAVPRSEPALV